MKINFLIVDRSPMTFHEDVLKSKNKEKRTIPVNRTIFEMLKAKAKVRSIETDLVFYDKNHNAWNGNSVSYSFHLVAKKANVQDFRFHDLRHTAATRMIQAEKDLYQVQRILGHKSSIHTQRYAHHSPESLRDAVEVLDRPITNLSQKATGD